MHRRAHETIYQLLGNMQIILSSTYPHSSCHFAREVLLASHRDHCTLVAYRLKAWVEVTHETKEAVMARVSREDLAAVGCNNPDIYVNGKRDDRIVLTRSRTNRNNEGKCKKCITNIRASEIFGETWPGKLNVLKLQTLGHFRQEILERHEHLKEILENENASVIFVRVAPSALLAYVCD